MARWRERPAVHRIAQLRRQRLTGPAIARALGMATSTVGLFPRRLGLNQLALIEPKAFCHPGITVRMPSSGAFL